MFSIRSPTLLINKKTRIGTDIAKKKIDFKIRNQRDISIVKFRIFAILISLIIIVGVCSARVSKFVTEAYCRTENIQGATHARQAYAT